MKKAYEFKRLSHSRKNLCILGNQKDVTKVTSSGETSNYSNVRVSVAFLYLQLLFLSEKLLKITLNFSIDHTLRDDTKSNNQFQQ